MGKGNSAALEIQRIANQTQVTLQKLVNSSNELQTRYNAEEAQKSRDWQTQMSKSAHQMEVEDLKKAGLNPVLSSGGSGAQSYTTSSASATPESGASALASLQGSQLGAIGQMESSRLAAAATRKAAAVSAAAMKSAAAQSAAAQIYSANKRYELGKYKADKAYDLGLKQQQNEKWMSQFKQASTPFGLADKYFSKFFNGVTSAIDKNAARQAGQKLYNSFTNNPQKFFNTSGGFSKNHFRLTNKGVLKVNSTLSQFGLQKTAQNQKLVVQAYVFGDQSAMKSLVNRMPKKTSIAVRFPRFY